MEMPLNEARALGCSCGTRKPVRAGRNVTPRDESTVAASALICVGLSNQCSFSQIQFKAEPVVGTKVSSE